MLYCLLEAHSGWSELGVLLTPYSSQHLISHYCPSPFIPSPLPPIPSPPSPPLPSFLSFLSPPPPEILLCLAWLALLVLGIVVQSLLSCRRSPFPSQSLYHKWSQKRKARRERRELGLSHNQKGLRTLAGSPQETSPLLGPSTSQGSHRLN